MNFKISFQIHNYFEENVSFNLNKKFLTIIYLIEIYFFYIIHKLYRIKNEKRYCKIQLIDLELLNINLHIT